LYKCSLDILRCVSAAAAM